jgi:phosphate-selective porin OprO/OprP
MTSTWSLAALLAATALTAPSAAHAQQADVAAELAAMRAKIESLEAKVAELEARKPAAAPAAAATVPSWKGAPLFEDKQAGWSFKPRGRIQYDAAWVGRPDGNQDPGLGFSNEARRMRLGAEGTIPGGFGYKFEVDFADNEVELTDAVLTYQAAKGLGVTIGQHNNFQSLEELSSSRFISFMERAAFTDAFNFERRVGVSLGYSTGDVIVQGGVFTDNVNDLANSGDGTGLGDENNSLSADGRIVYAPKLGETQLHVGGSAHLRDSGDTNELGVRTRYRQRPFVHTTNTRFLATPSLNVDKESDYGLELAAINGPFHAAAEAHWLTPSLPGAANPTFFGGYAELGWFITGETRGYKGGQWDRTKVLKPVGTAGGMGALQLNLRYDHLDLADAGINGGRQGGYQASLIWIPQDYIRFMLNYAHLSYDDAAIAAADGDRDYGIDVVGARAQLDF